MESELDVMLRSKNNENRQTLQNPAKVIIIPGKKQSFSFNTENPVTIGIDD
jgi:hypothetical protein